MMRSVPLVAVLLALLVACGETSRRDDGTSRGSSTSRVVRSPAEQILILEAARDKAAGELTVLLSKTPPDERGISEKRAAIRAVEETIASLRKRLRLSDHK